MNRLQQDIIKIEEEIEKVKNRNKFGTKTFDNIVRREKELWNAYFLDSLIKEKNTFEYISQMVEEDYSLLFGRINELEKEIRKLKKEEKEFMKPMSFIKLSEWVKEEDTLSNLFIMPIKISDVKKLLTKHDALHEMEENCILCGKKKENHIKCTTNDKVLWCYDNAEKKGKWAYQYTTKKEQDTYHESKDALNVEDEVRA